MSGVSTSRFQRRRRRSTVLGVLIAAAAIALALAVPSLAAARRSMLSGKDHLEQGQRSLLAGQARDAETSFAAASADFREAADSAGNPVLRAAGLVPLLGRTPDALGDLAQIGARLADAGQEITKGVDGLPRGLASLAPSGGRIPIANITALAPFVASAQASLEQAESIARRLPGSWLPGPVSDAVGSLREKLDKALPLARAAGSLLSTLPDFAGANGAKHYLVAGVNPAELRGTGGFMGVWSLMTIAGGKLSLAPFQDIRTLKNTRSSRVPAPTEDMAYLYGGGVASFWKAINSMPDAATAATLAEDLWKATHGTPLDGVIYVAPQALSLMLKAAGPVRSASLRTTLTSDNVVSFVTNKAYFRFGDSYSFTSSTARKQALGVAAGDVWNHFLAAAPPKQAVDALVGAASSGYIILHAADPRVQAAFEAAGIAGLWRNEGGDFFGTSINNASGTKIDYYMRRQLVYGVALEPDGSARASAQVIMSNDAPANPPAGYVFGPYPPGNGGVPLKPGESDSILQTYCAPGCELAGIKPTVNGKPLPVGQAAENGLTLFVSDQKIDPQETQTLDYELVLQNVWQGDASGGTYVLHLEGQPTIKPTTASVSITVPDGMSVTYASEGTTIVGNRVTWSGDVGKGIDIKVDFQPPLMSRTWERIKNFLNKPVIKL